MTRKALSLFDPALVKPAIVDSFKKLDPRLQWRNPVMFVVYAGSILTTVLWAQALGGHGEAPAGFILAIALWLWFTVLFANFAEALAEGRSKAQAASLRGAKKTVMAKKLREPRYGAQMDLLPGTELRRGDVVLVEAGDMIPADGEVIEGVASVNESAITGESASPANPPRSFENPAAISAPSPAAPPCCPTGSWSACRSIPARRSSTA